MQKHLTKFLIGALLVIISCGEIERKHSVDIDKETSELITSYIAENNIDIKNKVIVTQWVVTPYERSDIYISNTMFAAHMKLKNAPSYYCVLDDEIVVFIYSNMERLINRNSNEIVEEINHVLKEHKINLTPDSIQFYHAPTWLFTVCGDTKITHKKIPALEYTVIPCDYVLLQDTVMKNSLKLMKRK